jgi:hypothetical protein
VETLLAVPFLLLFALAMFDFGRGYRSAQQGGRAARHESWSAARGLDPPGHALPPGPAGTREWHVDGRNGPVTASHHESSFRTHVEGPLGVVASALGSMAKLEFGDVLKGVERFVGGVVDVTVGTAEQSLRGLRIPVSPRGGKPGSPEVLRSHLVSLHAHVDPDPSDPEGWFDPFQRLFRKFDHRSGLGPLKREP